MPMWWNEVADISIHAVHGNDGNIHPTAVIEDGAILNDRAGPICIGAGTKICAGAMITGPVKIGEACLIGNASLVRGPVIIGDDVRIGYSVEVKQARIADAVRVGPMCFIADTIIDKGAYLGAMVRTSNHRLDGKSVSAFTGQILTSTGREKLGCWIGEKAALGIQVIILPGRVVAANSIFEPRITIDKNYPQGHYRFQQSILNIC